MEAVLEPWKTLRSKSGFSDWLWARSPLLHWFLRKCVFVKSVFSRDLLINATCPRLPASEDIQASRWTSLECEHEKGQVTANCCSFDISFILIYKGIYIRNWIALVFQTGQALPLIKPWHPRLCCLSCPALCITLTGCLLSPAADSCVAHTAVRRVSPQGTCSGTWIRLAHHPVLPAPRLPSRVRLKWGAKAPELPVQAAASLYGPGAK